MTDENTAMFVVFVMVVVLVSLGFIQYEGDMPIVGTNSRAISAACHVLPEDVEKGHLEPLRWGVLSYDGEGVGHCALTARPDHQIDHLKEGQLYR